MARYGYRKGRRLTVKASVDGSTSAISVGDILTWGTAGFVQQAAAGDDVIAGVAMAEVASPTSDGDVTILMDVSEESIYEYPADAGSVSAGLAGTTMDIGGPQSINIDASADDDCPCVEVDTVANTVFVCFRTKLGYAGVA